ncbi:MAG: hypothetical protein ACI8P9_004830 [Parasphingorhabdus sp.]|jgi:hypothetical protein
MSMIKRCKYHRRALLFFLLGMTLSELGFALNSRNLELKLTQDVYIQQGWARAFIQSGEVVMHSKLDRFEPYCSIEVADVAKEEDQDKVSADIFHVNKVHNRHAPGLGLFPGLVRQEHDPTPVDLEVDIFLQSEAQPQVFRVRCVKTLYEPWPAKLTLGEIRKVLYPLVILQ